MNFSEFSKGFHISPLVLFIVEYRKHLERSTRGIRVGPYSRKSPNTSNISRNTGYITSNNIDIYERTGIFDDTFEEIFLLIKDALEQPRSHDPAAKARTTRMPTSLSSRTRLLMVLHWLRDYPKYKTLAALYGISRSQVSLEVHHIIPILYRRLRTIEWPDTFEKHPFEDVAGSIDCTPHFRNRVHPRQGDWYRSDKKRHFMTAQNVVGLSGIFYDARFGQGHNNDMNMFYLTEMNLFLEKHNIKLLSDAGYSNTNLVTPSSKTASKTWQQLQKDLRSAIETAQGMVKMWGYAGERVRESPEFQMMCTFVCYNLANINMKAFPLRF